MRKILPHIFLSFVTIFIILLLSEILVRKFKPQITFTQALKYSPDCYDSDPDIPFTLAKGRTCNMININGEFRTTAGLNSLGYRGKEFAIRKPSDKKRILIIGDSMTFGWGIPDDQTYPFHLENILKTKGYSAVEVINGGYSGGLSPDSFYVYLKNRGLELKPDIIMLGFFVWNDITDLAADTWEKVDKFGLPEKITSCCYKADKHFLRNKVIGFKFQNPILRESHLFILASDWLNSRFSLFPNPTQILHKGEMLMGCTLNPDCIDQFRPEEEKTRLLLKGIKRLADENNIKFLVVLLPIDVQLYPSALGKYKGLGVNWLPKQSEETFLQIRLGNFLEKEKISFFDLYPYFDTHRGAGYPFFTIDAHFNSIGTKLTAEAIAEYLEKSNWLR